MTCKGNKKNTFHKASDPSKSLGASRIRKLLPLRRKYDPRSPRNLDASDHFNDVLYNWSSRFVSPFNNSDIY